jgi:low affinity Fe/Cu permease
MSDSTPSELDQQDELTWVDRFHRASQAVTRAVGTPWALAAALVVVLVWAATGPIFGFSDTWQLVINTGTTIVTFLMVFAIQSSANRESRAMHLKLDELIRVTDEARNRLIDEEQQSEEQVARDEAEARRHAKQEEEEARRQGAQDTVEAQRQAESRS